MKYIITLSVLFLIQHSYAQQLYPFPKDGKWGYIDATGKIIVQPTYYSAGKFVEGFAKISKYNERDEYLYGFINHLGQEVIPPKFATVSDFDGGVARVKIRNQYHYLLKNGSILTTQGFDEIQVATNGISIFKKNGLYGYANINGRVIIPAKFTRAYNFSAEGFAIVSTNTDRKNEFGFINQQGNFIVEPKYSGAKHFVNGFAAIQHRRKWHIIDTKGQLVSEQGFDAVGEFANGLINVKKGGKWGYINSAGSQVIEFQFKTADKFSKGLAIVGDGDFFTYINPEGKPITPFTFTRATRFDGKLARVAKGKQNGFMNAAGRYNLTDKISSIGSFFEERARMKVNNYYGYYGHNAKLAIKPAFLHASDFDGDLALVVTPINGGYQVAYINKNGSIIKDWAVLYQPILKNKDIFYSMVYPSLPFYRDSDPTSRIIIRANYGDEFVKTHQKTATPLIGHGLQGLLYSAEYFARPGYIFSEVVTRYTPPKIGMGITPYFRENIGVISETDSPTAFKGSMNTIFFNAGTMYRSVDRSTVQDNYFMPFMKVSEAFFLIAAALGYPVSEYPENSSTLPNYLSRKETLRFTGRYNNEKKPTEFSLSLGRSRVRVIEDNYGVKINYTYPVPDMTSGRASKDPIFASDPKALEKLEELEAQSILSNELINSGYMISNTTHTNLIIEKVSSTNSIDITEALIQDRLSNQASVAIPVKTNTLTITNEIIQEVSIP